MVSLRVCKSGDAQHSPKAQINAQPGAVSPVCPTPTPLAMKMSHEKFWNTVILTDVLSL